MSKDENKNNQPLPSPSWEDEAPADKPRKTSKANVPSASASGSKIESEVVDDTYEDAGSGGGFLWAFGIVVFIIAGSFYGVLLWGLISGDIDSNPLFQALGIEQTGLQSLLITLTNFIFGAFALIFLLATLIHFFRWATLPRASVKKSRVLVRAIIHFLLFLLFTGGWFSLYYFISQFTVKADTSDIDKTLILSNPAEVVGLSAPITIEFDIRQKLYEKISEDRIRQINWDFEGDGNIDASGETVTYTFENKGENNGRFPVTAEVFYTNVDGEEISFQSIREVIIDNESVVPIITADPEVGSIPLEVTFSADQSFDPDGQVTYYEWDLDNDGEFELEGEELVTVTDIFAKVGEYTVQLRTTGTNSDDKAIATKVITANTPPSDLRAVIGTKDPLEGFAPLRIEFDGSNSFVKEGSIMKYEWLVEGETEPVPNRRLRRVFREPGEYIVTLTVENDLGERQQDEVLITVLTEEVEPEVVITTTPELGRNKDLLKGVVPLTVTFDSEDSVVSNPIEWRWDFQNDGIIDEFAQAAQYTFREPGFYEVKLEIVDANNRVYERILPVEIGPAGTEALITAVPPAGEAPFKVTLDGSGSRAESGEIVNYIWKFPGRDPISYGAQIDYVFRQVGNYQVVLEVLTSEGETAEDSIIVSARAPSLKAQFTPQPSGGVAPLNVRFTPGLISGVVQEYVWDFGDGTQRRFFRPESVEHTYVNPGTYTATLRVTGQTGITAEYVETITVQ